MILRNGKIIKNTKIQFSNNIKIEYYILRSFEKIQKKYIMIIFFLIINIFYKIFKIVFFYKL